MTSEQKRIMKVTLIVSMVSLLLISFYENTSSNELTSVKPEANQTNVPLVDMNKAQRGNASFSEKIIPTTVSLKNLTKFPTLSTSENSSIQKAVIREQTERHRPPIRVSNDSIPGPLPGTSTEVPNPVSKQNVTGIKKTAFEQISDGTFTIYSNHMNIHPRAAHLSTEIIDEPAVANDRQLVFYTGNHYVAKSVNGGSSWSYINQKSDMPDYCCDQDIVFDPVNHIFIWDRMGQPDTNGENRLRIGVSHDAITWFFYDIRPRLLESSWEHLNFDYPQVALSNHYLFLTSDIYGRTPNSNCSDPSQQCYSDPQDTIVIRAELNSLSTGLSTRFAFFVGGSKDLSFFPVQGATDTMYWGSQVSNNHMKVYSWNDASNIIISNYHHIIAWTDLPDDRHMSCSGPDNNNWCYNSYPTTITGGFLYNGKVGFFWNVPAGNGFRHPYIYAAIFDSRTSDLRYIGRQYIYSPNYAWEYGYGSPSNNGLGIVANYGGGSFYPSVAAGIFDDITSIHSRQMHSIVVGTDGPAPAPDGSNGWGDYIRVRPFSGIVSSGLWVASGFTLQGGKTSEFVQPNYFIFGRHVNSTNPQPVGIRSIQESAVPLSLLK